LATGFLFGILLLIGCGSSDGGMSDWEKPQAVTVVANIEGRLIGPVASPNIVAQALLVSVKGAKVFVEERPEYFSEVDENGRFIISNVPAGKYHLVADLLSGITTYRQRSDQINLTGEYATLLLNDAIQLVPAPYKVKINLSDMNTRAVLNSARLRVWGKDYYTDPSGDVEIGPLPQGIWPVAVESIGYNGMNFLAGFDSRKKGLLFVKMTPLTSVERNRAPIVSIEQGFTTIRTNGQGTLVASGFDPDGDAITYSWSTNGGYFLQNTGASTVFTAPPGDGSVEITLTAKDSQGAESKCVLQLDILSGGGLPPNPNNRPPLAAENPIPTNLATNMGAEVMLRWTGSDPDGDQLTFDVFMAERGNELTLIAEGISQTSYQLVNLKANTTFFWQVICRDIYGAISLSPVTWQFATGDQSNFSPYQPANPFPEDMAIDQLPAFRFTWTGGDPDLNDILTYTFMLGQDQAAMSVATVTRQTYYDVENLELGKTWYWKVISADNRGKETQGPVWQFSTYAAPNNPPSDPVLVYPASGAVGLPIDIQMRWQASDPDNDSLLFDVFFGREFPLTKVGSGLVAPVYTPQKYLETSSLYYLQVVVRDERGLANESSPVWSFETADKINGIPNVPVAVYPADASTGVGLRPVFTWTGGDPDGDAVTYDFYLGESVSLTEALASNLSVERYASLVDLEKGRKYYWKVVARDSAAHVVESPIFSFFTVSDVDLEAPQLISVTPEDNASAVNTDAEVRVVFSEPVNKTLAEGSFSFIPAVAGSWTWENDASVRFWPSSSWKPGSYHKFTIADNQVKDLAGNTMATGGTYRFTIKSEIPVPEGFRSAGFPISAIPGDVVNVTIPELISGGKSYAVAVAGDSGGSVTVRGSARASWHQQAPEAAFREFEKQLGNRAFPEVMLSKGQSEVRASLRANQGIGTQEEFYIPAYGSIATSTAFPNNRIRATCLGISGGVYVYVDDAITNPSATLLSEVRLRFEEGIMPKVRDVFGDEPEIGPDGDSRLTILITDAMSAGIAGIFYGADLFANDPGDIQLKESNGRKIFYLTYSLQSDITRYGTMAHEFQHMVNFWQKRINAGQGVFEETWLNEGLSKYSEEVCGYGILDGDQNTALLIKLSQENFSDLSVTEWEGLNSYGLSYLFVRFLAQENRYGTTYREVTRALVNSSLTGKANIEAITGESFAQTLGRWAISLYLNNFSSTDPVQYGFSGLNLRGAYAGVTLPGFTPVTVTSGSQNSVVLPKNGVRGFVRTSTGAAETGFELSNFGGKTDLWLFDQRP